MSGPITRARLLGLFDRSNEKLKQANQQGEVYIVVGAMMALAHDAKWVTEDVDPAAPRRPCGSPSAASSAPRTATRGSCWMSVSQTRARYSVSQFEGVTDAP